MLKESAHYKRVRRDDAEYQHNVWLEYERRKAILAGTAQSCDEYDAGIRRICDDLGI